MLLWKSGFLCGLVGSNEKERTDMKLGSALMKQDIADMKQEIADMKLGKAGMKLEINTLTFGLQCPSSDDDIQIYTGFLNSSTLNSFYEFLLPLAFNWITVAQILLRIIAQLMWNSPSRKLQPFDEMFLVLYHVWCNVLENDP